jgi:Rab GDP dissociation inhibitor
MEVPAVEIIKRVQLYAASMGLYGTSPFIYPVYGLGGIPEGFSRMSSVYGG